MLLTIYISSLDIPLNLLLPSGQIMDILSFHDICKDKYCQHDLEKAIEGLSEQGEVDRNGEVPVRVFEAYAKAYFEKCTKGRR